MIIARCELVVVRVLARGKLREPFNRRRFLRRLPRQGPEPKEGRQAAFDAVLVRAVARKIVAFMGFFIRALEYPTPRRSKPFDII